MGNSTSHVQMASGLPSLYGNKTGTAVRGAFQDRGRSERDSIIITTNDYLEIWNPRTADRRVRLREEHVTCVAYNATSPLGSIVLAGTQRGEVVIYQVDGLIELKRYKVCRGATYVTTVTSPGPNVFFCGRSDGTASAFSLNKAAASAEYNPPLDNDSVTAVATTEDPILSRSRTSEVVSIAVFGPQSKPVVAVALLGGTVHTYGYSDSQYIGKFSLPGPLRSVFSMAHYRALAASRLDDNAIYVRDWHMGSFTVLDPTEELKQQNRDHLTMTSVAYDDMRGIIFAAYTDGSILIRHLERNHETQELSMRLLRVCKPRKDAKAILSMWFDSKHDTLLAGDNCGLVRCIRDATNISERHVLRSSCDETELEMQIDHNDDVNNADHSAQDVPSQSRAEKVESKQPKETRSWIIRHAKGVVIVQSRGARAQPFFKLPSTQSNHDITGNVNLSKFLESCGLNDEALLDINEESFNDYVTPFAEYPSARYGSDLVGAPFGNSKLFQRGSASLSEEWVSQKTSTENLPLDAQYAHGLLNHMDWTFLSGHGDIQEVVYSSGDGSKTPKSSSMVATTQNADHHSELVLECKFSDDASFSSAVRRFFFTDEGFKVRTELHCRSSVRYPVGIALPFSIPSLEKNKSHNMLIEPPTFELGFTSPVQHASETLIATDAGPEFAVGVPFDAIGNIPKKGGGTLSLTELPISDKPHGSSQTSSVVSSGAVQLCNVEDGKVKLCRNDLNAQFILSWDHSQLSSLILKIAEDANGQLYAILCPATAAFDFGAASTDKRNPLNDRGIDTACSLKKGTTALFEYSLRLDVLQDQVEEDILARATEPIVQEETAPKQTAQANKNAANEDTTEIETEGDQNNESDDQVDEDQNHKDEDDDTQEEHNEHTQVTSNSRPNGGKRNRRKKNRR